MGNNYTIYHLHSDLSNGITNIDSVTKYKDYVEKAKKCGMKSLGFAEHGCVLEWYDKKIAIEDAGMKYIHACEFYVTSKIEEKRIRDNYHVVLIARNFDGFKELNNLVSISTDRTDGHFYFTPRITMDELMGTTDNIIVTTACLGGFLAKNIFHVGEKYKDVEPSDKEKVFECETADFLSWLSDNKHRCFLEIQHHAVEDQIKYNEYLVGLSKKIGVPLIAGTDTHSLDSTKAKGRVMLQKGKGIHFEEEDGWDLTFKTYEELLDSYKRQDSLSEDTYMEAIKNTNVMADMIEPFSLDRSTKYPKIYDDPNTVLKKHIYEKAEKHPYLRARYDWTDIKKWLDEEIEVYEKTGAADFVLLQEYLRDEEKKMGIRCGYSRGSVSGSLVAYALGITEMDSKKFNLNFSRFMSSERITNADIDTDYSGKDREAVRKFLLVDGMGLDGLQCADIITFNTIEKKGAVKDIGRALGMEVWETQEISDAIQKNSDGKWVVPSELEDKYPELFEYVSIVEGTIVSVGSHPSGILVSDLNIKEMIGLTTLKDSPYPVTSLNMGELDALMYVKLDILGLDNIGVVNETCDLVGIERANPDNTDLEDKKVWKSIADDTTMIFQFESNSAQAYLRRLMRPSTLNKVFGEVNNFSMIKWFSFANGLIRPACSSFRNDVADGNFYDNGMENLNKFFAATLGHCCMQEDIIMFLAEFCGYSRGEADVVRRAIAKKKGTEKLLPEISERFVTYSVAHFKEKKEVAENAIGPFLQVVQDASAYAFSWNHSDSYSCLGYICGYLRYYYPLEFITSNLNVFSGDDEKTTAIVKYANNHGILINSIKYGYSRANYFFDKESKTIYKGISSVKYMNETLAENLYEMSKEYRGSFVDILLKLKNEKIAKKNQIEGLIQLDFFSDFGNAKELTRINILLDNFNYGNISKYKKEKVPEDSFLFPLFQKYASDKGKNGNVLKSYKDIDIYKIMLACEKIILDEHGEDFTPAEKMAAQKEFLGYVVYATGKEEDRRKLYIRKVEPAKTKDGRVWGTRVYTRSIGSGKEAMLTIPHNKFWNPDTRKRESPPIERCGEVCCGDTIQIVRYIRKDADNGAVYFNLAEYVILNE